MESPIETKISTINRRDTDLWDSKIYQLAIPMPTPKLQQYANKKKMQHTSHTTTEGRTASRANTALNKNTHDGHKTHKNKSLTLSMTYPLPDTSTYRNG